MADEEITRSKLSEKDRKDTEDEEVGANISGVPKPKDTSKGKSKATTQAHENTEEEDEEATKKKLKELQIGVGDHAKGLERETNKSVRGKGIADSSGGEIEQASEIQSSETEMPLKTDDDENSESDIEIETNMEGLKEKMNEVVHRARKGKGKLDTEGKELDDDPEVETKVEGLTNAMLELYRQVTKEGQLERLMKNREEYSSGDEDEESESNRKCEMLLTTPLRLMLELDTEIRGLVEDLDELITSKDVKAGRKLGALRAELEALKESNYQKEVEVIGKVKGLIIDDGAPEELVIDAAVLESEVGPMVERAIEIIARVRSEIEEVEMDRNKSFGCCGGLNIDFLLNWK